jgi:hypothetical protein
MPRPPDIAVLTIDWGAPGTVVRTVALGASLDFAQAVIVTGRGVTARVMGRAAGLELEIAVAADAAAGPRVVQAVLHGMAVPGGALFHVRAAGSAGGAWGIGAQLL